jgi:hypothetical protein
MRRRSARVAAQARHRGALFQHGWSALWVALRLKQLHLYQEYSLLIFWEVFSTSSAKHLLGLELLR